MECNELAIVLHVARGVMESVYINGSRSFDWVSISHHFPESPQLRSPQFRAQSVAFGLPRRDA